MRNMILAVCGLSPQVITETLFALHQMGHCVETIHIITTRAGKERIYGTLLSGQSGHYYQYLQEYGIDSGTIDFGHQNIHVICDKQGIEIPDIINESDNELLLKKCLDLTFRFTRDPDQTVFFSVAGGRKTMSSCLTVAAQMYGRPQDRIYHVLVSPEFESNPNFYYPPKTSRPLELKDKNGHPFYKDTRYAEVTLVHLPFVSIRERLSAEFLRKPLDPATLMLSLIREERTKLVINLIQKKLIYGGVELDMMPARLALYAFFAQRKKDCHLPRETCRECTECFMDIQQIFEAHREIQKIYSRVAGKRPLEEMSDTGILSLNADNFNSYKSKIRQDIRGCFGIYALKDLQISSLAQRPKTRYGIGIDKNQIEIVY